jgi:hypothetical protein
VLTAASRTAQLRTVGTVASHFVPAYEILVRPLGTRTGLGAAATFAGQAPGPLYLVAAAAVVAGVLVTAAAAVLPTQALRRLPAAHVLAAD